MLLAAFAAALAAAGCAGESSDEGPTTGAAAPEGSLQARLDAQPGEDVGLILGTSDIAVGENRVSFLVVGNDGQVVATPTA